MENQSQYNIHRNMNGNNIELREKDGYMCLFRNGLPLRCPIQQRMITGVEDKQDLTGKITRKPLIDTLFCDNQCALFSENKSAGEPISIGQMCSANSDYKFYTQPE